MPWTAKQFASRHNKKLTGKAAGKAADMANAMIREGVPEGIAIATASKHGNKMRRQLAYKDHNPNEYLANKDPDDSLAFNLEV
jgi:uncharacterized protein YdaT